MYTSRVKSANYRTAIKGSLNSVLIIKYNIVSHYDVSSGVELGSRFHHTRSRRKPFIVSRNLLARWKKWANRLKTRERAFALSLQFVG